MTSEHPLILASGSPRRRQLMEAAGYRFEVVRPSDDAEDPIAPGEDPAEAVMRLARQKAEDVAGRVDRGVLIACDTIAECDGEVLGKPTDADDARRMLRKLRDTEHRVLTGLCVWRLPDAAPTTVVEETTLYMDRLSDEQLESYIASGGWRGKAGAFGYQDELGWVHIRRGSESNVVGLPMERLAELLRS